LRSRLAFTVGALAYIISLFASFSDIFPILAKVLQKSWLRIKISAPYTFTIAGNETIKTTGAYARIKLLRPGPERKAEAAGPRRSAGQYKVACKKNARSFL
jgi:hypothetical protein